MIVSLLLGLGLGLALAGEPDSGGSDDEVDIGLSTPAPVTGLPRGLCPSSPCVTDSPVPPLEPLALQSIARGAHRTERQGMIVLGSWAVVNIVTGTVGWGLAEDPRIRAIHSGNALWNTVNLGIAATSLANGLRQPTLPLNHGEVLRRADTLDRALLFNAGLDIGYMLGGLALREAGLRRNDPRFQGWGEALVVQGGFLFAFDIGLYLSHRRWTRRLLGR